MPRWREEGAGDPSMAALAVGPNGSLGGDLSCGALSSCPPGSHRLVVSPASLGPGPGVHCSLGPPSPGPAWALPPGHRKAGGVAGASWFLLSPLEAVLEGNLLVAVWLVAALETLRGRSPWPPFQRLLLGTPPRTEGADPGA